MLTAPVLSLRLGFSDEGNFNEETTTRQAYDLVAEGFGPGYNGPFLLAVEIDDPSDAAVVQQLAAEIATDPGVAEVSQPFPSNVDDPAASEAFVIRIVPTTSPQDVVTEETVQRLRDDVIPPIVDGTGIESNLTGAVPANIDFSDFLGGRIILFYGAVLTVSFLLLMMVFRSLLVPLKAVIMNMLSISAAYGVVVAIFQWGWFGGITGIEPAPIEPFVPMMLFAIVFGLSMDYEVFLLSRIKEEYDRTGRPRELRRRRPGRRRPGSSRPRPRSWSSCSAPSCSRTTASSSCSAPGSHSPSSSTPPSCACCSCPPRWSCWARATGGSRSGSTDRADPQRRRSRARRAPRQPRPQAEPEDRSSDPRHGRPGSQGARPCDANRSTPTIAGVTAWWSYVDSSWSRTTSRTRSGRTPTA